MTALALGHEGVMAKDPASRYEAGSRGAAWLKIKVAHTLDLVVLAAEWGSGRRQGWLSNLHLGARDPDGGFVMLGKTFKGLTDELLEWQTEQLQGARARPERPWLRRRGTARARRRDRVQRATGEPPLSGRARAAVRARRALSTATSGPRMPTRSTRCARSPRRSTAAHPDDHGLSRDRPAVTTGHGDR